MFPALALVSLSFLAIAYGQQVGTLTAESHPRLSVQQCSSGGSCQTLQRSVVLDSNWRWLHDVSSSTNCYTGNTWDASLCPDPTTCASNCALDGADYSGQYIQLYEPVNTTLTLGFRYLRYHDERQPALAEIRD